MIGVVRLGSRRRKDATAARMTSRAAVPHLGTPGRVPTECDVPPVYILVPKRYYGRPRGTLYVSLDPGLSTLRVALLSTLSPPFRTGLWPSRVHAFEASPRNALLLQ